MVKSKEEILEQLNQLIGDSVSDASLSLIEDVSDTLDNVNNENSGVDWQAKYNELDLEWRKKYKERFFTNEEANNDESIKEEPNNEDVTINDLFKEE